VAGEQTSELVFNVGLAVAIVATATSLGISLSVAELVAPLRRLRLLGAVLVVNVIVIPAVAWATAAAFGLTDDAVSGITLAAIGSAGAAGLKAAQLSRRADLALAVSIVIVLQVANVLAVPAWAGAVVRGATLSTVTILQSLLLLVLVPLVIGLVLRARSAARATRWHPILVHIANVALAIAVVAGVAANRSTVFGLFDSKVLLASIAIVGVAVALGMAVGGRKPEARAAVGLISGMRFAALGLIVIGTQLDGRDSILGPAIVYALVDLVVAIAIALAMARRTSAPDPSVRSG
jgi:BASS family bile acid:Na+ symporter